jgi:hypothetical protein
MTIPASPWWLPFIVAAALFPFGLGREKLQHRGQRLSLHHWIEGLTWGAGGLCVAGIGMVF